MEVDLEAEFDITRVIVHNGDAEQLSNSNVTLIISDREHATYHIDAASLHEQFNIRAASFYILATQSPTLVPTSTPTATPTQKPIAITGLGTSLSCTASAWSNANLPYLYAFNDGLSGNHIGDGGNDMYDSGNYVHIIHADGHWQNIHYTQSCGSSLVNPYGDLLYTTCKTYASPGTLWVLAVTSASNNIRGLYIHGNLGCDGQGYASANSSPLVYTYNRVTYYGYYKRVRCQNDPSINHLIITTSTGVHDWASNTDNDYHYLSLATPRGSMYYLLWAGLYNNYGVRYDSGKFLKVMQQFVHSCNA